MLWVPMRFFLGPHCGGGRCSLPPAPPHPLLFCNRLPLLPTPIPFAFSISIDDSGLYALLPSYFFLGPHCGGRRCALSPAPPHPLSVCNWRPLLPTPIPFAFSISINDLGSYALLSWSALRPHPLIFCNRRPLLPTPIPFAFSISNDLGSYVLLSSYFFLGTAALPPATPHPLLCLIRLPFLPSLIPSCHEHRLF